MSLVGRELWGCHRLQIGKRVDHLRCSVGCLVSSILLLMFYHARVLGFDDLNTVPLVASVASVE